MLLSNKALLPLLWEMFPRHPNLLPAYFEDDQKAGELGNSFVRKLTSASIRRDRLLTV